MRPRLITKYVQTLIFCFALVSISLLYPCTTFGQTGRLPQLSYYQNFNDFVLADYKDAGRAFTRGGSTAFRVGQRRYLDSICYWAMAGECYYHLGEYKLALGMYEQSLQLYISYQLENWQARITLPPTIQDNNNAYQQARITWGTPTRKARFARMPDSFSVLFGRLDAERVLEQGGMVENAEKKRVDITEIMRCTSLCIHRRRQILGPTAKYDPFTQQLIAGLRARGSGDGSVLGSFNGILLGSAYATNEEWEKAAKMLNASLQFRGGMDHPLTAVGLLELANVAVKTENYGAAGQLALQASFSAAVYNQFDLVEESLSLGTTIHLLSSKTPYPPLVNAIKWAASNRARLMQASLIVRLAECLSEGGQASESDAVLRQAKTPISSRNSLGNCVVSARLKYVAALNNFLNRDYNNGLSNLNAALKHFQTGSRWLFQLGMANSLVADARINQRQADLLYGVLLRDPNEMDWKMDPMEAMAFLATPHVLSLETWFDIVTDRKDYARAIEIADLVRRHRFFASLPLGGRQMSFRWMLHAPDEALAPEAIAQRQKFLASNREYADFLAKGNLMRDELRALPLQPAAGSEELHEKTKLLKRLSANTNLSEGYLASYALRREPAEMVFPPSSSLVLLKKQLEPKQVVLATLQTANGVYAFMIQADAIKFVGKFDPRKMTRAVAQLMKTLKASEIAFDVKELAETDWKEAAEELKKVLFGAVDDSNWANFDELIVIPDGVLWYAPLEALPITVGDEEKFLGEAVHVRYSPTLFLAVGEQRPWKELKNAAVITSRFSARGDNELTIAEFDELVKEVPEAVAFEKQIKTPTNLVASVFDQMVVWSEIKSPKGKPFLLNPTQIDQSNVGATVFDWMSLPWHGPENVIMPGFHSDGGQGLRAKQNGNDLFYTSLGLMASGSRSLLISRWATGGKTSLNLTREYSSRLPKMSAKEALRESQTIVREADLQFDLEPRLRSKKTDPVQKAEHPYFWAAHMLIEVPTGEMPDAIKIKREAEAKKKAEEEEQQVEEEEKEKPPGLFANPEGKKGQAGDGN